MSSHQLTQSDNEISHFQCRNSTDVHSGRHVTHVRTLYPVPPQEPMETKTGYEMTLEFRATLS